MGRVGQVPVAQGAEQEKHRERRAPSYALGHRANPVEKPWVSCSGVVSIAFVWILLSAQPVGVGRLR
jgi:hypothetical protein